MGCILGAPYLLFLADALFIDSGCHFEGWWGDEEAGWGCRVAQLKINARVLGRVMLINLGQVVLMYGGLLWCETDARVVSFQNYQYYGVHSQNTSRTPLPGTSVDI